MLSLFYSYPSNALCRDVRTRPIEIPQRTRCYPLRTIEYYDLIQKDIHF